jgi:hypothetical protein
VRCLWIQAYATKIKNSKRVKPDYFQIELREDKIEMGDGRLNQSIKLNMSNGVCVCVCVCKGTDTKTWIKMLIWSKCLRWAGTHGCLL